MKVLVACEFSGTVRDAFIRAGHDAISVDLEPSESDLGPHHQGDVLAFMDEHSGEFDLIIAHPPCTYLTHSSVQWMYKHDSYEFDPERWAAMVEGARFFDTFRGRAPRVAIENPPPHSYAKKIIGAPDQVIQPWQFGDPLKKATGLWLENLPPLVPTNIVDNPKPYVNDMWPGHKGNRRKERSRFFVGIANAMAAQWGDLL